MRRHFNPYVQRVYIDEARVFEMSDTVRILGEDTRNEDKLVMKVTIERFSRPSKPNFI